MENRDKHRNTIYRPDVVICFYKNVSAGSKEHHSMTWLSLISSAFSPILLSMLKMYSITKGNPHFQLTAAANLNFAAT